MIGYAEKSVNNLLSSTLLSWISNEIASKILLYPLVFVAVLYISYMSVAQDRDELRYDKQEHACLMLKNMQREQSIEYSRSIQLTQLSCEKIAMNEDSVKQSGYAGQAKINVSFVVVICDEEFVLGWLTLQREHWNCLRSFIHLSIS